ncbi:MAG: response regulator [Spirochaetes bacterium]|nr:response regulator [Spirochaetota bacterium]
MIPENTQRAGDNTSPAPQDFQILESLRYPACILGSDGILLYGNSTFRRYFRTENNAMRLDWEHPFFPEYRKRIAQSYLNALKGQETRCFAVLNSPEGTQLPVEIYLFPMHTGESVTSIMVFLNIVDDRILSFNRTTLSMISEENFNYESMLYEFSPVPIVRFNQRSEIIRCSQTAESFLGISMADTKNGSPFPLKSAFIYDADRIKNAITEITGGTSTFHRIGEVKISTTAGQQKIANLILYPIIQEGEIVAVEMILEDITAFKDMRDQLVSMKQVNLINNITKGLLHSFNNTINIIMSKTQLLLQITEKESVIEGIQLIEESAMEIIHQIRRFNNYISKDGIAPDDYLEPLINIVEDAIEFFRLQFKIEEKDAKRAIAIERKYFSNVFVKTNTKHLREVIISAILKVSDFIATRGSIEITLKENGDLNLQVRVNHGGAPDEKELHTEYASAGIDIRQTAEKIGLKIIEEESQEFYSIKIIIPSKLVRDKQEKEEEELEYRLRDLDIIIVEDEPALQRILYELFDRMGNRVFICANGNDALEEFKKKHYHMVVTDYGIEGITGIELAARIKEIDESTVTILLSGWLVDDIPSYKNIVDLFIPKPFKLDDMLKKISKIFLAREKSAESQNHRP